MIVVALEACTTAVASVPERKADGLIGKAEQGFPQGVSGEGTQPFREQRHPEQKEPHAAEQAQDEIGHGLFNPGDSMALFRNMLPKPGMRISRLLRQRLEQPA